MSPRRADGTIPALDGIRALAIGSVVWFHFIPDMVPGGWMGMSIFFPLSGFLVTRLLLRERDRAGTVLLGAFWLRRAQRLFPALYVMLVVVGAVVALQGDWGSDDTGAALSSLLYVNNWWQLTHSVDYWDAFQRTASPFEHLWSLSVEEQFYLCWPVVLWLVVRYAERPMRRLLEVAVAIMIAGAVVGLWLGSRDHSMTGIYYNTIVRAGELLAGSALAVWHHARPGEFERRRDLLQAGATIVVAVYVVVWLQLEGAADGLVAQGGMFVAGLGTCLLIAAVLGEGFTADWLSAPLLVWMGTRCYGLYLWHWPVVVFVDEASTGWDGIQLIALRTAITVALTVISWWVVEAPFRRRRVVG